MKVEIATSYRTGEIAYAAGVLVDELVRTEIPGTQAWPHVKDTWIDHIRDKRPFDVFDLTAKGLRIGYRGYQDNATKLNLRKLSLIFEEPRIIVATDESQLLVEQVIGVEKVLGTLLQGFELVKDLPKTSLVFPKIVYANEIILYDTQIHDLH